MTPPIRILVIDDDAVDRKAIRRALKKTDFDAQVAEVGDGAVALRALTEGQFDCAFLDCLSPGTDGMQILVKAREAGCVVPIIVLTGQGDDRLAADLMRAGASDCLAKDSITSDTLSRSLGGALRVHQAEAERRRAEEDLRRSNERIGNVLESISDAFFAIDNDGRFTYGNTSAGALLERAREDLVGRILWEELEPSLSGLRDHLRAAMEAGKATGFEWHLAGRGIWLDVHVYPHAEGLSAYLRDITDRKVAQAQLVPQPNRDALTGLPDRSLLMDRIDQALSRAPWHERFVAVLFCDLDRFKIINDSFGHAVGDELLKMAARRLLHGARDGDTVARPGGDEFVVVLSDVASEADIERVAEKLLGRLTDPYCIDGRERVVTSSIGISVYPNDGPDGESLLKHADTAVSRAKERGGNAFAFYAPTMSQDARARLTLVSDLRRAMQRSEFRLYFQPLIGVRTGAIVGSEALLRWHHPDRGLLAPDAFMAAAEDNGLIVPIGEWVLREACARNAQWQAEGLVHAPIAVNLPHRQFDQDGLVDLVRVTLARSGLAPEFLELALTETVVMDRAQASTAPLRALEDMGVRLAIDDFGTGHSSLADLKRVPLDVLKIDRSFVADIARDPRVSAIVAMANTMNLSVVAKGVETPEQAALLMEQGCDRVQGSLVSRPLDADAYREFLRTWSAGDLAEVLDPERLRQIA